MSKRNRDNSGFASIILVVIIFLIAFVLLFNPGNSDDSYSDDELKTISSLMSSYTDEYDDDYYENSSNGDESTEEDDTKQVRSEYTKQKEDFSESYGDKDYVYDYWLLSNVEKVIYDRIQNGIDDGTFEASFGDMRPKPKSDELQRAVDAFKADHPEYHWILYYEYYSDSIFSNGVSSVSLTNFYYADSYGEMVETSGELSSALDKVCNQISRYGSDYEKVKAAHDYLVLNCVYDYDAIEKDSYSEMSGGQQMAYTAYGALVNGRCVCAGYAKAFELIMHRFGIKCGYVSGETYTGGLHAWNIVELDGDNYYIDVTWDDYESYDDYGNNIYPDFAEYEYFCVDSKTFSQTHYDSDEFVLPLCTADKYNYFIREDCYISDRNQYSFIKCAFDRQATSYNVSIRFANSSLQSYYWSDCCSYAGDVYKRMDFDDYSVFSNDEQYIYHFYFYH